MKVKDLLDACQEQIDKGNGDKLILISDDNSGNSFHQLSYLFEDDKDVIDSCEYNSDKFVLLG